MDSKETKNIWVAVGVIALVIGGAYYFSTSSSTSPINPTENNPVNNSLTNSPVVPSTAQETPTPTPTPKKVQAEIPQNTDMVIKCDAEAKYWFDYYNKQATPGNVQNYKNHYDVGTGGCYMLWSWQSAAGNNVAIAYNLYDVFSKSPKGSPAAGFPIILGGVGTDHFGKIYECYVEGQKCTSIEEFLSLAQPYLSN